MFLSLRFIFWHNCLTQWSINLFYPLFFTVQFYKNNAKIV